jgi:uncharacterized protein (DUF58 family)
MLKADLFAAILHSNNTFTTVSELNKLAFDFEPTFKARFEMDEKGRYRLSNSMYYFSDGSRLWVNKYANNDLELRVYPFPRRKDNREPKLP